MEKLILMGKPSSDTSFWLGSQTENSSSDESNGLSNPTSNDSLTSQKAPVDKAVKDERLCLSERHSPLPTTNEDVDGNWVHRLPKEFLTRPKSPVNQNTNSSEEGVSREFQTTDDESLKPTPVAPPKKSLGSGSTDTDERALSNVPFPFGLKDLDSSSNREGSSAQGIAEKVDLQDVLKFRDCTTDTDERALSDFRVPLTTSNEVTADSRTPTGLRIVSTESTQPSLPKSYNLENGSNSSEWTTISWSSSVSDDRLPPVPKTSSVLRISSEESTDILSSSFRSNLKSSGYTTDIDESGLSDNGPKTPLCKSIATYSDNFLTDAELTEDDNNNITTGTTKFPEYTDDSPDSAIRDMMKSSGYIADEDEGDLIEFSSSDKGSLKSSTKSIKGRPINNKSSEMLNILEENSSISSILATDEIIGPSSSDESGLTNERNSGQIVANEADLDTDSWGTVESEMSEMKSVRSKRCKTRRHFLGRKSPTRLKLDKFKKALIPSQVGLGVVPKYLSEPTLLKTNLIQRTSVSILNKLGVDDLFAKAEIALRPISPLTSTEVDTTLIEIQLANLNARLKEMTSLQAAMSNCNSILLQRQRELVILKDDFMAFKQGLVDEVRALELEDNELKKRFRNLRMSKKHVIRKEISKEKQIRELGKSKASLRQREVELENKRAECDHIKEKYRSIKAQLLLETSEMLEGPYDIRQGLLPGFKLAKEAQIEQFRKQVTAHDVIDAKLAEAGIPNPFRRSESLDKMMVDRRMDGDQNS